MIWTILIVVGVGFLAFAIRAATKNTPFEHSCGCTPRIAQLKHLETEDPEYDKVKKEKLW